ncbi:MAG TPA: metalloregulator ArsR/SmtB family transcription factor [Kofleriaceae bacterium]|nr:metalloregulator ArsR/SmtB family transcription factor [Kofleriaceae bacterium]
MSDNAPTHAAKQRIYEQFARIAKALAAPARLELLDLLHQGERSVDALARATELSVANTSQHLQVLAAARLVETRRDGQRILYRVADASVEALWHALRRTAEARIAELDQVVRAYLIGRDELEAIDRDELVRRLRAGTVTLVDVRPPEEFAQGHIRGAISVPLDRIPAYAKRAPRGGLTVAYCRGPYCVYAVQAVAALRKRGVQAKRFEDGVSEWRAAGLPVERSAP